MKKTMDDIVNKLNQYFDKNEIKLYIIKSKNIKFSIDIWFNLNN